MSFIRRLVSDDSHLGRFVSKISNAIDEWQTSHPNIATVLKSTACGIAVASPDFGLINEHPEFAMRRFGFGVLLGAILSTRHCVKASLKEYGIDFNEVFSETYKEIDKSLEYTDSFLGNIRKWIHRGFHSVCEVKDKHPQLIPTAVATYYMANSIMSYAGKRMGNEFTYGGWTRLLANTAFMFFGIRTFVDNAWQELSSFKLVKNFLIEARFYSKFYSMAEAQAKELPQRINLILASRYSKKDLDLGFEFLTKALRHSENMPFSQFIPSNHAQFFNCYSVLYRVAKQRRKLKDDKLSLIEYGHRLFQAVMLFEKMQRRDKSLELIDEIAAHALQRKDPYAQTIIGLMYDALGENERADNIYKRIVGDAVGGLEISQEALEEYFERVSTPSKADVRLIKGETVKLGSSKNSILLLKPLEDLHTARMGAGLFDLLAKAGGYDDESRSVAVLHGEQGAYDLIKMADGDTLAKYIKKHPREKRRILDMMYRQMILQDNVLHEAVRNRFEIDGEILEFYDVFLHDPEYLAKRFATIPFGLLEYYSGIPVDESVRSLVLPHTPDYQDYINKAGLPLFAVLDSGEQNTKVSRKGRKRTLVSFDFHNFIKQNNRTLLLRANSPRDWAALRSTTNQLFGREEIGLDEFRRFEQLYNEFHDIAPRKESIESKVGLHMTLAARDFTLLGYAARNLMELSSRITDPEKLNLAKQNAADKFFYQSKAFQESAFRLCTEMPSDIQHQGNDLYTASRELRRQRDAILRAA